MLIQYTSQQFGNELNNKNKREEAFAYGEQEIFDSAGCNGNAGSFTIVLKSKGKESKKSISSTSVALLYLFILTSEGILLKS